jgi:hypothetical protein
VNVAVVVSPEELVAVTVYGCAGEIAVGVPLMIPVPSIPMESGGGSVLMLNPAGSAGEMLYAGISTPLEL